MFNPDPGSGYTNRYMKKFICMLAIIVLALACAPDIIYSGEWYMGDLHAHSMYSNGDSSVADMIARAESLGFDFFALTDHDTSMYGNPVHWRDTDYRSDDMVLLYGVEWTNSSGHANIWSQTPFSYGEMWAANQENAPQAALASAHEQNALFSINHPASQIFVTAWNYSVPAGVDSVEVWNAMYRLPSLNRWAEHYFWDGILKKGRRLPGVGGSDTHMLTGWMSLFWELGNPTTWVYAEELTAEAILGGIKAGHVSISYAPDAPRVDLRADADGDEDYETMMGDMIQQSGRNISFKVQIIESSTGKNKQNKKPLELEASLVRKLESGAVTPKDIFTFFNTGEPYAYLAGVFKNGKLFRVWLLFQGSDSFTFNDVPFSLTYYRVELIGNPAVTPVNHLLYGRVSALTNPVYVNFSE